MLPGRRQLAPAWLYFLTSLSFPAWNILTMKFIVDPDIAVARTLDTSFYLDEQVFQSAKEQIFSKCWHYIGDDSYVARNNDCYPFMLLPSYLDEPLVITRNSAGRMHCLSNVCTHRGNIVVQQVCNQPQLRCGYHGRIFGHDGGFRSMPEFKEVKDFPTPDDNLARLTLDNWGPLLFASLSERSNSDAFFAEMKQRLSWLPLTEFVFRPELSETFTVDAHWALYCENYLEGFHIPFVHAGLNSVIDFRSYSTELFPYSSLQLGIAKKDEHCFDLPASSPDHGKKVAAYYFFVFPNMMFNFYPWGLSINIIEPVNLAQTRVRFLNYVWKEELLGKGAGASLRKVEMEDEEIVEAVQKGVRSRFYKHGRYSVTQEKGTHHFHRLICEFMNRH
jgi:choline monooxygenase